ncbi:MAG: hypothetical protein KA144_02785 [Xanthomonadaceae bacterium]|nr:hypothetical protein [Xanthomonadaceae bacterium]
MRADMYKVIVERPRRSGGMRGEDSAPIDLDDSPRQEGLRRRHRCRKDLNENLAPLRRYLASQVGRPWDKVFSDICAGIDRRNTVQRHIHQHLEDFVAIRVYDVGGELQIDGRWRGHVPLANCWTPEFYVHPRHGLLCVNEGRIRARRDYDRERHAHLRATREGAREDRRILGENTQLHRIAGVWYRVELSAITNEAMLELRIDALRKLPVDRCPRQYATKGIASSDDLFGNPNVYARSKRQLSSHELRQHGLFNDDA